jgi:hypothetical protein
MPASQFLWTPAHQLALGAGPLLSPSVVPPPWAQTAHFCPHALPLLRPAPRAELGEPQWPLPAPPGPGAAALPARLAEPRKTRALLAWIFGPIPQLPWGALAAART